MEWLSPLQATLAGIRLMSYYDILGIPFDADEETVRSAYRTLVRRYHPDAGAGSSVERFRQVVEAYETLNDPAHRRLYDASLRPPVRQKVVPVESMVGGPGPFVRDTHAQTGIFFRRTSSPDWDAFLEEIFRSMDDWLGRSPFRW